MLGVLFFARTAMGFQFQSIGSVSPLLVDEMGIDFGLLGALIGIWMLPGVVVAIPGGLLGRRFGDKRVVLAGLALMVLGTLLVSAAASYALAMAGRLISGAGAVLLNVRAPHHGCRPAGDGVGDAAHPRHAVAARGTDAVLLAGVPGGIIAALPGRALSEHARHLGMGIFFTLYYVGMALLPPLAGWLGDFTGRQAAPLGFGAALLVIAVALAFVFRRVERGG